MHMKPILTSLVLLVPFIIKSQCQKFTTTPSTAIPWGQCGCVTYFPPAYKVANWTSIKNDVCTLQSLHQQHGPSCTHCLPDTVNNVTLPSIQMLAASTASSRTIPARMLPNGAFDYGQVLNLSLLFYEAQRAGKLPNLPKRSRTPWRGDSVLKDKTPNGKRITKGGWFDAGDNMRFNFPMAWSAGVIAWSVELFRPAYKSTGTLDNALDNLRWVSDYFIECYYAQDSIIAQLGNGQTDHSVWSRPEYIDTPSKVYTLSPSKPGSDLAGSIAGFLAIMSRIMRDSDAGYADKCLLNANKYYTFATKYIGKYSVSVPDAANFYPSSHMYDDLAWGAINMYATTKSRKYLNDAKLYMQAHWTREGTPWKNYDWDSHAWGAKVMLTKYAPDLKRAKKEVDDFMSTWLAGNMDGYSGPKYTPKGLAWFSPWGSLRHSGNAAFLMLAYSKESSYSINEAQNKRMVCFAHNQIRYMLGAKGRSFVVGYGVNPPMRPHHRGSSCPLVPKQCGWSWFDKKTENPSVLYGALVGGPDINDVYHDDRTNYIDNEVATDYNAGFTGALAGLSLSKWTHAQC